MAAFLEIVAQRCFVKKMFVNILLNSQENAFAGATFLIMLQARGLQLYVKKRICHRCFPEKLANFVKQLYCKTPAIGCFFILKIMHKKTKTYGKTRNVIPRQFNIWDGMSAILIVHFETIAKLTISIASAVSLRDGPCY